MLKALKKRRAGNITEWLPLDTKPFPSQYGIIGPREWLQKEKERIEAGTPGTVLLIEEAHGHVVLKRAPSA